MSKNKKEYIIRFIEYPNLEKPEPTSTALNIVSRNVRKEGAKLAT